MKDNQQRTITPSDISLMLQRGESHRPSTSNGIPLNVYDLDDASSSATVTLRSGEETDELITSRLGARQGSFTLGSPSLPDLPVINDELTFPRVEHTNESCLSKMPDLDVQVERLRTVRINLVKYHKYRMADLERKHKHDMETLDAQISYLNSIIGRMSLNSNVATLSERRHSILGVENVTERSGEIVQHKANGFNVQSEISNLKSSRSLIDTTLVMSSNLCNDELLPTDFFQAPIASVIMNIVKKEGARSERSNKSYTSRSTSKCPDNPGLKSLSRVKDTCHKNMQMLNAKIGEKMLALIRGHLTRRLMKVERLKKLVQTIKDLRTQLYLLRNDNDLNTSDQQFSVTIESQLNSKLNQLHSFLFDKSVAEKMKLIAHDRFVILRRKIRENKIRSGLPIKKVAQQTFLSSNTVAVKAMPVSRRSQRPLWKRVPITTSSTFVVKRSATPVVAAKRPTSGKNLKFGAKKIAPKTADSKMDKKNVPERSKTCDTKPWY